MATPFVIHIQKIVDTVGAFSYFHIPKPSEVDLTKILERGCMDFK